MLISNGYRLFVNSISTNNDFNIFEFYNVIFSSARFWNVARYHYCINKSDGFNHNHRPHLHLLLKQTTHILLKLQPFVY